MFGGRLSPEVGVGRLTPQHGRGGQYAFTRVCSPSPRITDGRVRVPGCLAGNAHPLRGPAVDRPTFLIPSGASALFVATPARNNDYVFGLGMLRA